MVALTKVQDGGLNLTSAGMPSGTILQVVTAPFSTQVTTSSTSFVTLGSPAIQGTITPSSTSSKIIIRFITSIYTNSSAHSCYITLYRGTVASGTHLGQSTEGLGRAWNSSDQAMQNMAFEVVDEPSTTSAQVYQVGFRTDNAATAKYFMLSNTPAQLVLMEIAA